MRWWILTAWVFLALPGCTDRASNTDRAAEQKPAAAETKLLKVAVAMYAHETCTFCPGGDTTIEDWTRLSPPAKGAELLSFGGFGLSAVGAVMFLTQEKDLKLHKFRAILSKLPSLERLEVAMTRLVWIAFGLLTAGLVTSSAYLHQVKNVWFQPDPEMLWVIGVWIFYLVLLMLQKRHAQSGRRFAWGTLGSFLFVMLTFWGVYLLSPLHQPPAS